MRFAERRAHLFPNGLSEADGFRGGRIGTAGPPRCGPGGIGSGRQREWWRAGGVVYLLRLGVENKVWRVEFLGLQSRGVEPLEGTDHDRFRRAAMVDDDPSQFLP
jgi:hypothetical protein